jgi:hypothetical protein
MGITLDHDVEKVLEFMERHIEQGKLVRVAASVAALAPILWDDDLVTFMPESRHEQLAIATQSHPVQANGHDGSGEALDTR